PGSGRRFAGAAGSERAAVYLGRFDQEIRLRKAVSVGPINRFWARKRFRSAMIPSRALERAVAIDILTVPLLRALSLGDSERAEQLGCLALVEEDLAAATERCTSGVDYGACLRNVLSDLQAEAV
ncbi:MAG: hypothetical protein AAFY31_06750, partial [Pseudomonadota bacterium]